MDARKRTARQRKIASAQVQRRQLLDEIDKIRRGRWLRFGVPRERAARVVALAEADLRRLDRRIFWLVNNDQDEEAFDSAE